MGKAQRVASFQSADASSGRSNRIRCDNACLSYARIDYWDSSSLYLFQSNRPIPSSRKSSPTVSNYWSDVLCTLSIVAILFTRTLGTMVHEGHSSQLLCMDNCSHAT